jgi:hypothetical protein
MSIMYWGWHVAHERAHPLHGCLYHHSPNIHACIRYGGPHAIWDEVHFRCLLLNGAVRRVLDSPVYNATDPALGVAMYHADSPPPGTALYNDRCFDQSLSRVNETSSKRLTRAAASG